jgi:succinate dehydrogenase / fumarate reductase, cytochrome b subunit
MRWLLNLFTSSIGQKLIMSLTGIFLILFLVVHLIGNLQLLMDDGGESFNLYAHFMTHNPIITFISYGLYAFIVIHSIQGLALWAKNRAARGAQGYAVKVTRATTTTPWIAKSMAALGTIILVFILIHMYQFWFMMHWGDLEIVKYDGALHEVKNLAALVADTYTSLPFVIFYVVSMVVVAFHLWHGFQSAFRTLGLSHHKYVPVVQFLGKAYAILVPLLFAVIPIVMYLNQR